MKYERLVAEGILMLRIQWLLDEVAGTPTPGLPSLPEEADCGC